MREQARSRGRSPRLERLPLAPDQQQAAAELAALGGATDNGEIVRLTDTLVTKDRYQANFELAESSLAGAGRSGLEHLIDLSWVASTMVVGGSYEVGQPQNPHFNKLAEERLAACAVVCHPPLRNMPLDRTMRELSRMQSLAQRGAYGRQYIRYANHLRGLAMLKIDQQAFKQIDLNERKESRFVGNLVRENDELFRCVRQLQKYSVKSAYIADTSQLPVVDWHIYNVADMVGRLPETDSHPSVCPIEKSLARFDGFGIPLVDKPPTLKLFDDGNQEVVAVSYEGLVVGQPKPVSPSISFDLWGDGQLYSLGGAALAWFADELGLGIQYEMTRARALSLYADMVIPAYVVDDSQEIRSAEQASAQTTRAKVGSFTDLVLARRRVIDQHPDLLELIAKEAKDRARTLRRHGVAGFIRKLPDSQRASQKQRALCLKDQEIRLAETGETYVRSHMRGGEKDSDEVVIDGHRARLRYVGMVATLDAQADRPDLLTANDITDSRLVLPGLR